MRHANAQYTDHAGPAGTANPMAQRELSHIGAGREEGAIGYILLWLMGVPASILFLVFLLRGCT